MRYFLLFGCLWLAGPGQAQTLSSLSPARNAKAVSRTTSVAATYSGPLASTASLRVFSAQVGGQRIGTTTINGNSIVFAPFTTFRAGETVTATVVPRLGNRGTVWQFITAATGGTGIFTQVSSVYTLPNSGNFGSSSVSTADLDGDGDLDVLVPNSMGQALSWFVNDGSGRLLPTSRTIPTAQGVQNVAVGDIDADGDLDVVAAPDRPAQIDVASNDGLGNFTTVAIPTAPATSAVSGLTLFDVDGDADLDMVYYNWSSQAPRQIEVRLNNGSGVFAAPLVSVVSQQYYYGRLLPADMDSDGDLDLVLCGNTTISGVNGFAQVLFNNGSGAFTPGPTYPAANYSGGVAAGDVDGDGDLDLAVIDFQPVSPVKFLLNNGAGVFTAGATLPSGYAAQRLSFADVDGDGDLDLMVHGTGNFLHLNDGRGNFGPLTTVSASGAPYNLDLADMDNDGDIDLITIDSGTNAPLQVRINGSGTITAIQAPAVPAFRCWPNPVASAAALRVELPTGVAATATLRDIQGRLVREEFLHEAVAVISTIGLQTGVYLLTVQAGQNPPLTRRVMVE